jgi:hypothetical protein
MYIIRGWAFLSYIYYCLPASGADAITYVEPIYSGVYGRFGMAPSDLTSEFA